MLRKTMIVVLVTGALSLSIVGLTSLWREVDWHGGVANQHWARIGTDSGNLYLTYAHKLERKSPPNGHTFRLGALGVLSLQNGANGRWRWVAVSVPLWMLVIALIAHPAVTFARGPVLRRRRRRRNLCLECGYDRRGNTSHVCPECGCTLGMLVS